MDLGISSYTFTWAVGVDGYQKPRHPLSALGLIEKAKNLGLSVVQICNNMPLDLLSNVEIKELSSVVRKERIELEIGTQGVDPACLYQYLNLANQLNAKLVRTTLHSGNSMPDIYQAIKWLKQIARDFEADSVRIAIENHDKYSSENLVKIVEEVDSPSVGICLDTVNSLGVLECPGFVVKKLAPYTINLHIKDFKIQRVQHQMGFLVTGCPAGDGQLDIDMVLNVLHEEGKTPNKILELWTPFNETIEKTTETENEWCEKSIKFLKGILINEKQ